MKERDHFIILNFMKKQTQTSLMTLYIELTYIHTIYYKRVKYH